MKNYTDLKSCLKLAQESFACVSDELGEAEFAINEALDEANELQQRNDDLEDENERLMDDLSDMKDAADEIERLTNELREARAALVPFSHPDLRLQLGGNSDREGRDAVVFQRNGAYLRLRDFDAAALSNKQESVAPYGSLDWLLADTEQETE